jgi:hypothetical protein
MKAMPKKAREHMDTQALMISAENDEYVEKLELIWTRRRAVSTLF